MTLKRGSAATTPSRFFYLGSLLLLLFSVTACTSQNSIQIPKESAQMDEQKLTVTPDALENPPILTSGETEVQLFAADWKHPRNVVSLSNETKDVPNIKVSDGSLRLKLSEVALPASLTLSIYKEGIKELDPTRSPDLTFDCLDTSSKECVFTLHEDRTGDLVAEQISAEEMVVTLQGEFYADAGLNGERFVNTVAWVFSVN